MLHKATKVSVVGNEKYLNCHQNSENYVRTYGGRRVNGYMVVFSNTLDAYELIRHSVVRKQGKIFDITYNRSPYINFIETNLEVKDLKERIIMNQTDMEQYLKD